MKNALLKKTIDRAKGNKILTFLFFLLVSCSLWLSLTLNREHEADIPVRIYIKNLPEGVELSGGRRLATTVRIKGDGTDIFGYLFEEGIVISVDYKEFRREGGRISMPANAIRGRVLTELGQSLTIVRFASDSLATDIKRVTKRLPVSRSVAGILPAEGYELVSIEYLPDSLDVTAYVDVMPSIEEIYTHPLNCRALSCDSLFNVELLPGEYITTEPTELKVRAIASRIVHEEKVVPVEYVNFMAYMSTDVLPKSIVVKYDILEIDAPKVGPEDISVRIDFDAYREAFVAGRKEEKFEVSTTSPYVRNLRAIPETTPVVALGIILLE